ncbi:hypothetical protein PCURB6_12260 [Paenibacillus curdlanolyticus]|nr:hypothetical protein PCURB6_12260 [Paenibacillus curdlanolyticus]
MKGHLIEGDRPRIGWHSAAMIDLFLYFATKLVRNHTKMPFQVDLWPFWAKIVTINQ